jgi:hypothetical protein
MNYLDIVLKGYFNRNNREHLSKYFFREFKKAEKEYYEADEFFNGCLNVIEAFERNLDKQIYEEKKELYLGLNLARQGLKGLEQGISESELRKRINFRDNRGLTYKQLCQEEISECEKRLKEISKDEFEVYKYNIPGAEVRYIRDAIREAHKNNMPHPEASEKKKLYKSLTRARAFYIYQMYLDKKITEDVFSSRIKLIKRIEQEFPKQKDDVVYSGKTVYEALRTGSNAINLNFTKVRGDNLDDYNFGMELYKMNYPDT